MRWTKRIAAFCCAAMIPGVCAAGLLPNGGAEQGKAGWVGDVALADSNVFAGKYAFAIRIPESGTARMTLGTAFRYGEKPARLYFSGVFYSADRNAAVTVRPLMYDRYGHPFERTAGNPVASTETRQLVKIEPEGKVLSLAWNPAWRPGDDLAVAFYASPDGSDLPTLMVREVGIKAVRRTDSGMTVTLMRAPGESFSVGTVRLHRVSRFGEFISGVECRPGAFHRLSGEIECAALVPFMSIELVVKGEPGTVVTVDNLELAAEPLNLPELPDGLKPDESAHRQMLEFYADFGYRADCFYQDCGTAVDMAAMKLDGVGRAADAETVWRDSATLRAAYVRLMDRFYNLAESYSVLPGSGVEFVQRRATIENELQQFQVQGEAVLARSRELTKDLPPGGPAFSLVPGAEKPSGDYLTGRFTFGIDLGYEFFGEGKLAHTGNRFDPEYVASAVNDAGVNILTLNVIRNGKWHEFVSALDRNLACPFLVWTSDEKAFADGDAISYAYFGNVGKLASDAGAFAKNFAGLNRFAGFQLDEPMILDKHSRFGRLIHNRAMMEQWSGYARDVATELQKQGAKVTISQRRPASERNGRFPDTVEYLAWQFFKSAYSGEHLALAVKALSSGGKLVGAVLTDWNSSNPQCTSFVSMASKLPYVGTDLYYNGDVSESFSMQLLKSAALDRAVMWPGAGYSCKSAAAFDRSMAAGLAYGDGVQVWTYEYCSKYRDPNIFWRTGSAPPNLDDRGRLMLGNWSPDLWDSFRRFGAVAGNASIANRRSIAQTALIFSERQAIVSGRARRYYDAQVGLYSAAVAANVPCSVEFMECLTPERLAAYRVVFAGGLECLSKEQCDMLRAYVKNGGVLVTFGGISSRSEWGAELHAPALGDLLGASFNGVQPGGGVCGTPFGPVGSDSGSDVLRLGYENNSKYYLWNIRGIGMVENSVGKGKTYCFALMDGGYFWNGYHFYPGLEQFVEKLAAEHCELPFEFENLPAYVEVSARVNDRSELVIVLINRTALSGRETPIISGHRLRLVSGGNLEVRAVGSDGSRSIESSAKASLPDFENYQLLVVKTEGGFK
ncbi:MAG: hypothetical protein AB7F40_11935 [Victivallaceae bacterium]|nr:hypothetical protein [Victivallaceae bacterium]